MSGGPAGPAPPVGQDVRSLLATSADDLGSRAEARWVVAQALGVDAGELVARMAEAVAPAAAGAVQEMVRRRRAGEPLQYVLGSWAFRTLELAVDPRVLIPRPETEHLVDVALGELCRPVTGDRGGGRGAPDRGGPGRRPASRGPVVVDLGAGSGAIALSLAVEAPALGVVPLVWATDVSAGALEVLTANVARLAASRPEAAARVHPVLGSWFDALPPELAGHVRLVVSNPPYVSEAEWAALDPEVRDHEPRGALVPGPTGLEAVDAILADARTWLDPAGSVVVELAPGQARRVLATAVALGYVDAEVRRDLAGRPRVLVARREGAHDEAEGAGAPAAPSDPR